MSSKHCGQFGNGSLVVKQSPNTIFYNGWNFVFVFFCSFETEQLFETNRRATIVVSFIECVLFSLWTNVYVSFRMFLYYVVGICVYTIYPFNFLRGGVMIIFVFFFPQYCYSWSNVYTVLSSLDVFTGAGILFRVQGEINVTHDIFYKFFFQDTSVLNSQVLITRMS